MPEKFEINDNMITLPANEADARKVEIVRGPNIKPLPSNPPLGDAVSAEVVLKVGDNITTDHIMPAGAKILPLRSNIPAISEYCFSVVDESFPTRAKAAKESGGGIIVGGSNYGQGSSREHAALAPVYLGIKVVLCKSFARIHRQNLINNGIIPLTFIEEGDYEQISQGERIELPFIKEEIMSGEKITINFGKSETKCENSLTIRERDIILAGGLLQLTIDS
jgi:aconitate hydratase